MSSQFQRDLKQQQLVRDLVLGPGLYGLFHEGRYVYVDKGRFAEELQHRACDTLINGQDNQLVAIEEKIVRWPGYQYDAICLEVMSCTVPGRERVGWIHPDHESVADWLNYVFCQEDGSLICNMIPFQPLKKAFWPSRENFKTTKTTQINETLSAVVPLKWITESAEIQISRRRLMPTPEGAEAVKAYNSTHYKNGGTNDRLF